jgi:hypothetical protein
MTGVGQSESRRMARPDLPWRDYDRRSNAKRPDRDRSEHSPCNRCGKLRTRRDNKSGLCRDCMVADRAAVYAKARALRATGLSFAQIGHELGIATMTAWRAAQ